MSGDPDRDSAARAAANERLEVLYGIAELLLLFGVANDAEDHQSGREAVELRARASSGLRASLEEHAFVGELLPELRWRLEDSWLLEVAGWSNQRDLVLAEIRRLEGSDGSDGEARG